MKKTLAGLCLVGLTVMLIGCTLGKSDSSALSDADLADSFAAPGLKDGELMVPANYRSWPVYLHNIDKEAGSQIRDIYISPAGHQTARGDDFPDGTISVMELWKAKSGDDGTLMKTADGKLVKDELSLIFLMGKSKGAGESVAAELRNGDWVYSGFQADGVTPGGPDAAACRECHLSEKDTDWVFRYDEYFDKRGG